MSNRAGQVRTAQTWIGGNGLNPCDADFVPPPPATTRNCSRTFSHFSIQTRLLRSCRPPSPTPNSKRFIPSRTAMAGWVQPSSTSCCVDANWRASMSRQSVSCWATESSAYVVGLTRWRTLASAVSPDALDARAEWIGLFASATRRSVGRMLSSCAKRYRLWKNAGGNSPRQFVQIRPPICCFVSCHRPQSSPPMLPRG